MLELLVEGEAGYLQLMGEILARGQLNRDRTGVGTRSIFGTMLRFNLRDGTVPVLTTKRVAWKTAIKEMLWFLDGGTNIRPLIQQGVYIWSDWPLAHYRKITGEDVSKAQFEERILYDEKFAARWGELGPVYGKQWRNWIGPDGVAHDQIATLVETLRRNPTSRRMIVHGWNVGELATMALPPCHLLYQYRVGPENTLDCILYQRSADLFLGSPFNFVGASALQLMLAQQAGLEPGVLTWMGGDVHLYRNHTDAVLKQLKRRPMELPRMELATRASSIDDYQIEDFTLSGYDPYDAIRAPVAV